MYTPGGGRIRVGADPDRFKMKLNTRHQAAVWEAHMRPVAEVQAMVYHYYSKVCARTHLCMRARASRWSVRLGAATTGRPCAPWGLQAHPRRPCLTCVARMRVCARCWPVPGGVH
jgi:hypothetical protein